MAAAGPPPYSGPMIGPSPDRATFRELARGAGPGALIPLFRRFTSDQLTPVTAYRRLTAEAPANGPSFLLESVEGGDRVGRYSYLGAFPRGEASVRGAELTFTDHADPAASGTETCADPLGALGQRSAAHHLVPVPGAPPFTGGWVGAVGYDVVRFYEPEKLGPGPPDDRRLPTLHMQLYREIVAFDHVQKSMLPITHVAPGEHASADAAYDAGIERLEALCARLEAPASGGPELAAGELRLDTPAPALPASNMGEGGYQRAVETIKQYIAAGDAFQVVPSQRFAVPTSATPFDLYRALRVVNPSPYMFYLTIEGGVLVGASPEILCRVEDGIVTNRPLAGTRPRSADPERDRALEHELRTDEKERAEHAMLVDLGRNDVGRVAEPGSVRLEQTMAVERYSHVMHLSSTVTGKLRADCSCWDALRVTLPVGTVSGAPKVRAMQIIDELEPTRRGPYAGAVGHVDLAGNMDTAIALRTLVVTPQAERDPQRPWLAHLQAGGGIVADSDPEEEHRETVNKAAALAKTIEIAESAFSPALSEESR